MTTYALSSLGGAGWQFFDNTGRILAGGRLYTYRAGTTTPLQTWADHAGDTSNGVYVELDSAGRPPAEIWCDASDLYKFVVKKFVSTGVYSDIRTYDYVPSITAASDLSGPTGAGLVGYAANGAYTAGTVGKHLQQIVISVTDAPFHALGDGATDDTAAIQAAINHVQDSVVTNAGGGIIYFPAGKYRVQGTLSIDTNFITLKGAGVQSTYLDFANGTVDCISIDGGVSGLRDVRILDMALNGNGKTAGATVKVRNAYRCTFQNVALEYAITGFDIGGGTNSITIRDATIIANLAASLHGIWWHCLVDGSERSDVLVLNNVLVSGSWSNATCILWDGFCATMEASHLRLLHASRGLLIKNSTPSASYFPQFLNAVDIEAEGFKNRAVSIEAGACFKISDSDISNLTGGDPSQGNADDFALAIVDDASSATRSISITNTRLGLCRQSAAYISAQDVQMSNIICASASAAGSGSYPAIKIDNAANNVQLANIRGEEYGGLGRTSYAVQIEASATEVQLVNIDGTAAVTGAVNNLTSGTRVQIINAIDPGGAPHGFCSVGNYETRFQITYDGVVNSKVQNASSDNSAVAANDIATGIANSFVTRRLLNNSGTPYYQEAAGSAVGIFYRDVDSHFFRDRSGNNIAAFLSTAGATGIGWRAQLAPASTSYANDAAAAAGGVPVGGVYRNGSALQVRIV